MVFLCFVCGIDEVLRVSGLGVRYRAWSVLYVLWRFLAERYPVERL